MLNCVQVSTSIPDTVEMARVAAPRVLVADDHPMNRKLLSAIFEAAGFEVGLAENGEQALAEIAGRPPSVVLLDLRMPGLSGMETLGKIRTLAPHIPVIILTSYGDVPAAVEAIKMGAY